MADFLFKNATQEDIPLIQELNLQVWPQTYREILSEEQITYMLDMMYSTDALQKQFTEEHCEFIILTHITTPVGFASYSEVKNHTFKLHKIYILPSMQVKGAGRFLLSEIIRRIKNREGKELELNVNRHNNAKSFYERMGFTIKEEVDVHIGNGYFMNDYIMRYKI